MAYFQSKTTSQLLQIKIIVLICAKAARKSAQKGQSNINNLEENYDEKGKHKTNREEKLCESR